MDFFLGMFVTFLLGVAALIVLTAIHMIFNPTNFNEDFSESPNWDERVEVEENE